MLDTNSNTNNKQQQLQQTSNRGSQGVGIVLSSKGVEAWRAAGCELHNISARVIAVRLLLQDCRNKDIGVFLVSAYAHVGVAEDLLWDFFFR